MAKVLLVLLLHVMLQEARAGIMPTSQRRKWGFKVPGALLVIYMGCPMLGKPGTSEKERRSDKAIQHFTIRKPRHSLVIAPCSFGVLQVQGCASRVSFDRHSTGRNSTCVAWLEKCLSSIFLAASLILKKTKPKQNSIRATSHMHLHGIKCLQS